MQREMAEQRDRKRAEADAEAAARKRQLDTQKFLRKDHGKQAFGYLAHEGGVDRQVWSRPDDNLKRLGHFDEFHVSSGGAQSAARSSASGHIRSLEEAVHTRNPHLRASSAGGRRSSQGSAPSQPTAPSRSRVRPPAPMTPTQSSKSTGSLSHEQATASASALPPLRSSDSSASTVPSRRSTSLSPLPPLNRSRAKAPQANFERCRTTSPREGPDA